MFRLTGGVAKVRYTDDGKAPERRRTMFISSSNMPIRDLLRHEPGQVAAAAEVRVLSIPARASDLGIFDCLPEGQSSSSSAWQAVHAGTANFFGTAIREFLRRLVNNLSKNPKRVRDKLRFWIGRFLRKAKVDRNNGPEHRNAKAFALVYAAGMLAKMYGVIPESAGPIGTAILKCYRASIGAGIASPRKPAIEQIVSYLETHRHDIADLTSGTLPKLSKDDFDAAPGFVRRGDDGGLELLIPPQIMQAQFPNWQPLMRELRDNGQAVCEKGRARKLTVKRSVRKSNDRDRVYTIRLPANVVWP